MIAMAKRCSGGIKGVPKHWWTTTEVETLCARHGTVTMDVIARELGRSHQAVQAKAKKLGLSKPNFFLSDKQESELRDQYGRIPSRVLASRFGCSRDVISYLARRRGLKARMGNPYRKGVVDSEQTRQRRAIASGRPKGIPFSKEHCELLRSAARRRFARNTSREIEKLGQYLTTNAQRLIMEGSEKNGIAAGNEDVMQSSDGSWLLAELQKSFDTSVKHIVRMAAIVRRLDELGVAIEMESSVLPYLRKIAHGNLSPDLFVTMQGHKSMLNIASTLPAPIQQQIAKNEPIKVMQTNGDFRMVPPLSMTTKEVSQVFAFGRIRDEAEQVGYLRGKMQEKTATEQACEEEAVKIDRKRRGIVVGKTFISFIELEHFYKALAPKKKQRQAS